jgi:hypothetical protein
MTDIPLDANGSAYTKPEIRTGVPLDYVSMKLTSAIESVHSFFKLNPQMGHQLQATMHYQLVAFLALHNMLAAANDPELARRLLSGTSEDLDRWIKLVVSQGDVLGVGDC